jgi:aminobenzoyl-glutamate transport protein
VFVPLFVQLAVDPAAVSAAYRVGDSPTNAITPLNAYFAMVVGFAQNCDKNVGVGTVVALMLLYALCMAIVWTLLFAGGTNDQRRNPQTRPNGRRAHERERFGTRI